MSNKQRAGENVIYVELKEPYNGKKSWFFGSKSAIYEAIPSSLIGIKLASLWNINLKERSYENKFCTIRMGKITRKKKKE